MITITSKQEGFRRCGIVHSKRPTQYEVFNAADLAICQAEPMLIVEITEQKDIKPKAKKGAE